MAASTEATNVHLANIEGNMDQNINANATSHHQDVGSHAEITDLKNKLARVEALCATLHTEHDKLTIRVTQLEKAKTIAQDTLAQGNEIDNEVNVAAAQVTHLEANSTTTTDAICPSVETDVVGISIAEAAQLEDQNAAALCDVPQIIGIDASVSSSTTQVAEPKPKDITTLSTVSQKTELDDSVNVASRQSSPLSWLSQTPTHDLDFGESQFNYKHLLEPGSDDEFTPTKRLRTDSESSQPASDRDIDAGEDQPLGREENAEDGHSFPTANLPSGQNFEAVTQVSHGTIVVNGDQYGMLAEPTVIAPSPLRPEVWSNKRGGLCEALDYYNAYKGSIYTSGRIVRGVLLDGEADRLDIFSAQVIIASVGGGRIKENGVMVRTQDSADNSVGIESVFRTWEARTPVAIIAGKNHPKYPCTPPAVYAVLDFFHITNVWKEVELTARGQFVKVWRIRFEKVDLNKISWWQPNGLHISDASAAPIPTVKACDHCQVQSVQVFSKVWTCLNHSCEAYYSGLSDILARDPSSLVYSSAFINQRNPNPIALGSLPDLKPPMPDLIALGSHGTDLISRRGFVCQLCGCCNRRVYWSHLVCENKSCNFTQPAQIFPYPLAAIDNEIQLMGNFMARKSTRNGVNQNVLMGPLYDPYASVLNRHCLTTMNTLDICGYKVRQYILPDNMGRPIGSFTLFISNPNINAAVNGPTYMFNELERADIGLKRNTVAGGTEQYEGLSRHFQQNFGAKYKFAVSVQSKGFSEAHPVILMGLQRLIWAGKVAVDVTTQVLAVHAPHEHFPPPMGNDFNELLALGYRESDSIRYHDDGEKELGPTVAALSLGSPSTMKFRPKKAETGFDGIVKRNSLGDFDAILEVPMKHGDMMVMHGSRIHGIYEHSVEPRGERRFSLTSRFVDPAKMASDEDRAAARVNGAIPAAAAAYAYNGF